MSKKISENYISLQEAVKHCSYSQEYLSLRARQGKLKAIRLGRNWVTKKEWLDDYIKKVEEYNNALELKELAKAEKEFPKEAPAPELQDVFQKTIEPPVNLPVGEVACLKEKIRASAKLKELTKLLDVGRFAKLAQPAMAMSLVSVLLVAGAVFGKESLKNVFQEADSFTELVGQAGDTVAKEVFVENFKTSLQDIKDAAKKISEYAYIMEGAPQIVGESGDIVLQGAVKVFSEIGGESFKNVSSDAKIIGSAIGKRISGPGQYMAVLVSPETLDETLETFEEFGGWASDNLKFKISNLKNRYLTFEGGVKNGLSDLNYFVEEKLLAADRGLAQAEDKLSSFFLLVGEKTDAGFRRIVSEIDNRTQSLSQGAKEISQNIADSLSGVYQFVSQPWQKEKEPGIAGKAGGKKEGETGKIGETGEMGGVGGEKGKKEEKGVIVREVIKEVEVSRVTKVEPVKEISKETIVTKIDDKAVQQFKSDIAYLQTELAKRLYAPGGVISQQIVIKEPVASPKIYQENGDIVLQTVGGGNVYMTAATGIQIAGKQVVIDSTDTSVPYILLNDRTRISGNAEILGNVTTGAISGQALTLNAVSGYGKILDVQTGGVSKFSVQDTGAVSVTGDITINGALTNNGTLTLATSSTGAILTVTQSGTGPSATFSGGLVGIGTTSPAYGLELKASSTNGYFAISNISPGGGDILTIDGSGQLALGTSSPAGLFNIGTTTDILTVTTAGRMGIGTTSPAASLQVWGNGTYSSLFTNGNVGIGTTTPSEMLMVWGGGYFGTSTRPTLYIASSTGKVAIGTSSPASLLEVYSQTDNSQLTVTVATDTTSLDPTIAFRTGASPATKFLLGVDYSGPNQFKIATSTFGTNDLLTIDYTTGNISIATTSTSTLFAIGTTTPIFNVTTAGRVGIGTASPASLFDVNSKLNVLSSGLVGIGTTSPASILEIVKTGTGDQEVLRLTAMSGQPYITIGEGATAANQAGWLAWKADHLELGEHSGTGGLPAIVIDDFSVLVATTSTSTAKLFYVGTTTEALNVSMGGRVGSLSTWVADGDTAVYKDDATGRLGLITSDIRLKKNLEPLENALDIVSNITAYKFNMKDEEDGAKKRLGVVAQELLPYLPEAIYTIGNSESGEQYFGVHYDRLVALALQAVKEQQKQIEELKLQLNLQGAIGTETATSPGLVGSFVGNVKQALSSLGIWLEDGVMKLKELVVERLTAKQARMDKIEMVDKATGETWCNWIENGEWQKAQGACDQAQAAPEPPQDSPVLEAEEPPTEQSPVEQPTTETTSEQPAADQPVSGESLPTEEPTI